ncbi:MAG: RNA pseudouridine synthase [Chlamydiota bacterium]
MEILYADNHLIVVNKPFGIPTESTEEMSLEHQVKLWVKEKYDKKGEVFVRAAHRLDKSATGIVVFAKTSKALERLHESFRTRQVQKTYLALVEGEIMEESGLFEDHLLRKEYCSAICSATHPLAKKAVLSYKVQKRLRGYSLVEIDLHTGRYHQIRIQFSSRGHPVVNDGKYGAKRIEKAHHIALHHAKLQIIHPVSKETLIFTLPLPTEWKRFSSDLPEFFVV